MEITFNNLLPELKHPLVRDLAWSIFSPSLIKKSANLSISSHVQPLTDAAQEFLLALDHTPLDLTTYIGKTATGRLGFYFEKLWQYWLINGPYANRSQREYRFNQPFHLANKTLGEADLLAYDTKALRLEHSELAVKFFLGVASTSAENTVDYSWVGPGQKDRLDKKIEHLTHRQLRLLENPAVISLLPSNWQTNTLTRSAIVKGRLFHPFQQQLPLPDYVNDDHESGEWLRLQELSQLIARCQEQNHLDEQTYWCMLARHQWFAPLSLQMTPASGQAHVFNAPQLINQASHLLSQENDRPQQLVRLQRSGSTLTEQARYFIVPNHWPREISRT